MIFSKSSLIAIGLGILLGLSIALPTFAMDLKEARSKGLVKELKSGFIEPKGEDPKDLIKKLVKEVNAKRKAHYEKVAKKNKTSAEQVARQAAIKIQKKLEKK